MIRRFLSIAFAGVLAACAIDPPQPPPPTEPPVFDHLIVPGKRVGPVSLGMKRDQVLASLGLPVDTYVYPGGSVGLLYERHTNADGSYHDGLEIQVSGRSSQVEYIQIASFNSGYATAEGLAVGMQERKVRELMGPPEKVVLKTAHTFDTFCYQGLRVYFSEGEVVRIAVNPWGCSKL